MAENQLPVDFEPHYALTELRQQNDTLTGDMTVLRLSTIKGQKVAEAQFLEISASSPKWLE